MYFPAIPGIESNSALFLLSYETIFFPDVYPYSPSRHSPPPGGIFFNHDPPISKKFPRFIYFSWAIAMFVLAQYLIFDEGETEWPSLPFYRAVNFFFPRYTAYCIFYRYLDRRKRNFCFRVFALYLDFCATQIIRR